MHNKGRPQFFRRREAGLSRSVTGDRLDARGAKLGVERVAVVDAVADEPFGQLLQEPLLERFDDELLLIALTTRIPLAARLLGSVALRAALVAVERLLQRFT
jgi:hypothetical protein